MVSSSTGPSGKSIGNYVLSKTLGEGTFGKVKLGVHLLTEAADRVGRPASFYSVAQAAAGPKAGALIDALVALNAFGVSTSYLIVVGDAIPEVAASMNAPAALANRTLWIGIMLAVAGPLAFLRSLSALRFTAYLAFVCVLYISLLVGLYAIAPVTPYKHDFEPCANATATSCRGAVEMITGVTTVLDAMPIFIFAFTCHQNAISITNELARPTSRRAFTAAAGAIVLALALYLLVGIGGYMTYGELAKPDILESYPEHALMPLIGRLAIAFVVTTCYPMQLHPGRASLISLIGFASPSLVARLGGKDGASLHLLTTSALIAATLGVALPVKDLGKMLAIIGAICSTSVTFIIPGGSYAVLFADDGRWRAKRLLAIGQLCLGLIIAPLCLTLTFL